MGRIAVLGVLVAVVPAQAQTLSELANGRICAVSLDGKRSGVLVFEQGGAALNVHVYRSENGDLYKQMKANPDGGSIKRIAQQMQDQGVHPVATYGNRLKFTNGLGAYPDLALSSDGTKLTGKATTTTFPVTFDGFCVK